MLKGFVTLILIFGVGVLLFSVAMPKEFAVFREYTQEKYQLLSDYFSNNSASTVAQQETTNTNEVPPLIASDTEKEGSQSGILTSADIIDATNAERIKNGLEPLKRNTKLDTSATVKVKDMITLQYFEHESPSGTTVSDLGELVGYDYIVMGENLALGNFANGKELVAAWMASPGHRANILSKKFQEIGVYAAEATYNGRSVWFAVQHFGTQKSVCPSISTDLKNEIMSLNNQLSTREKQIEQMKENLEKPDTQFSNDYDQLVTDFNNLVALYNNTLAISKQKTTVYNGQVNAFNACLAQFQ